MERKSMKTISRLDVEDTIHPSIHLQPCTSLSRCIPRLFLIAFYSLEFQSYNLNCHSKQVDEWVCTFSVFQFSLKCSPRLHPLLGIPRLAVSLGDENISYTGCFFSKGPTQKSSKYGIGPSQQDKIAKYTGPTQSYQMSELLTSNFCCKRLLFCGTAIFPVLYSL